MVAQHVTVSGRNMELGDALPLHIEQQMDALSNKYFGELMTCRIVFTKLPKHAVKCHIQVIVGHDLHYVSEAEFDDVYGCFRLAKDRLAKQLRRDKRELHDDKASSGKTATLDEMLRPDPEPEMPTRSSLSPLD